MLNIVLYLILVIFGIVFAILYTKYQVAIFVGVLLLYPILSTIMTVISCLFLKVSIMEQEKQVYKNEEFKVFIKVKNPTIIPITCGELSFSFKYDILGRWNKRKLSFQLRGRDESICVLTLKSEYCGTVDLFLKRVWIKDFFRIFKVGKRIKKVSQKVILPELKTLPLQVPRTVLLYNDEYDEFYEDHPGNDASEVFDIREYKEGDMLQRVHWKLSSKKDKLMVKEFSDPVVINTVILCDNIACISSTKKRGRKSEREMSFLKEWSLVMEKTIQASYTLLLQEVIHYVYWFDGKYSKGMKREIRTIQDWNQCMNELLCSQTYEHVEEYIGYLVHSENIQQYMNIFYVGKYNYELFEQSGILAKVVE